MPTKEVIKIPEKKFKPEIAEAISEFRKVYSKLSELELAVNELKAKKESLANKIKPAMGKLSSVATRVEDVLINLNRIQYPNPKYKEAFDLALTKVNEQTRIILEEALEETKGSVDYIKMKIIGSLSKTGINSDEEAEEIMDELAEWLDKELDILNDYVIDLEDLADEMLGDELEVAASVEKKADTFSTPMTEEDWIETNRIYEKVIEKGLNFDELRDILENHTEYDSKVYDLFSDLVLFGSDENFTEEFVINEIKKAGLEDDLKQAISNWWKEKVSRGIIKEEIKKQADILDSDRFKVEFREPVASSTQSGKLMMRVYVYDLNPKVHYLNMDSTDITFLPDKEMEAHQEGLDWAVKRIEEMKQQDASKKVATLDYVHRTKQGEGIIEDFLDRYENRILSGEFKSGEELSKIIYDENGNNYYVSLTYALGIDDLVPKELAFAGFEKVIKDIQNQTVEASKKVADKDDKLRTTIKKNIDIYDDKIKADLLNVVGIWRVDKIISGADWMTFREFSVGYEIYFDDAIEETEAKEIIKIFANELKKDGVISDYVILSGDPEHYANHWTLDVEFINFQGFGNPDTLVRGGEAFLCSFCS